jgi:hypothetical protein
MRQYGREDIDYATWYSAWHKRLTMLHTRAELVAMMGKADKEAKRASRSHLRAIQATGSMTGCSQRRAQTRNSVYGASELRMAVNAALEIYELFPEHTKEAHARQEAPQA